MYGDGLDECYGESVLYGYQTIIQLYGTAGNMAKNAVMQTKVEMKKKNGFVKDDSVTQIMNFKKEETIPKAVSEYAFFV